MSKVAFALFNQDLAPAPNPSHWGIIEELCAFFTAAYKLDGLKGKQNSDNTPNNANLSSSAAESTERRKVDILRALSAVLFENGIHVKGSQQDLLQIIVTASDNTKQLEQSELRRMALNCMANMVHKTGSLFSTLHERMYEVLYSNLTATSHYESSSTSGTSTTTRRRDRGSERKEDKNISVRSIPPLMSVICRFMFFTSESWASQPISSTSSSGVNIRIIQRSSYSTSANIIPFTKSTGASSNTTQGLDLLEPSYMSYRNMQSSDSEYSDSECGVHQAQRIQHDGKVRLNALLCLQALARAAPKQLQPHWPKFLTNSSSMPMTAGTYKAPSLIGLIGSDPILNVRSAACVVLGNILESSKLYLAMSEENTGQSGTKNVRENILSGPTTASDDTTPEFLSRLLGLVESLEVPMVVRLEAWNTLRAVAQFHFDAIRTVWLRLDEALGSEQNLEDIRLRSAGLLFLEEYSKSGASASDPLTAEWWKDVMERHILKAFGEESPTIKALGCDCISHLSFDAFNGLPNRLEMLIMSLVLGTAIDEHATARAAACRAIGVFILFPSLREDSTHVIDMASTVLDLCQDPNMNVRVRASWAVGNMCDALVLLKTGGQEQVLDEVLTLALWTKVMKTALLICRDHEKLKSNGIRAIGGLLRVTFEGILERERHSLVKDAVYALIKHMEHGSLKGRWNACYAMQNVLLNSHFPIGSTAGTSYALDSDMVSWTRDVYGALLQAIQHSKNFKVRINACAALLVPETRAKYGDQVMMRKMVQVLMAAVQNLNEEQGEHEFGEFQYRGQLEMKILRCLDHLLQLTGGVASLDLEMDPALRQRIVASRPEVVESPPPPTLQASANP
ncbi:armadillo-type protein [Dissophora ornata]|nr:armadillo-type protein [Dissophora ornata]